MAPADIVSGVLIIFTSCIGVVGNVASIMYFGRRAYRRKTFFVLLVCLAVFDMNYLIVKLFFSKTVANVSKVFSYFVDSTKLYYFLGIHRRTLPDLIFMLHMITVTGSIFFTVSICIERYVVICRPFSHQSNPIHWKVYVTTVLFLTFTLNIIFYFLSFFKYSDHTVYIIVMLSSLIFLPCIILIVANVFIVRDLIKNRKTFFGVSVAKSKESIEDNTEMEKHVPTISARVDNVKSVSRIDRQRKKNAELAVMSLIIDMVFIISHLLNSTSFIFQFSPGLERLSDLLVVINSSINFYLYMIKKLINRYV